MIMSILLDSRLFSSQMFLMIRVWLLYEQEAQRKKAENAAKRKEREEREEKLKHQPNAIHAPEDKKPRLEQVRVRG